MAFEGRVFSVDIEGRHLAQASDCKYIEVSAILNHKVDDLLVGMLKQIRLNLERETNTGRQRPSTGDPSIDPILSSDALGPSSSQTAVPLCQPSKASVWSGNSLLAKLFGAARKPSMKSCEDLLTWYIGSGDVIATSFFQRWSGSKDEIITSL